MVKELSLCMVHLISDPEHACDIKLLSYRMKIQIMYVRYYE